MKKLLSFAIIIALLFSSATAFGSVGYKKDGVPQGNAASIDVEGGYSTFDGSTVTIFTNGYKDGVTTLASDADKSSDMDSVELAFGVCIFADIGSLGKATNTGAGDSASRRISLAAGSDGQMITFILLTATGGTLYITDDWVSAAEQAAVVETGWDDIAMDAALDSVTLLYVDDTYGWIIVGGNSITVT